MIGDRSKQGLVTGNSDFAGVSSDAARHCPPHSFLSQGGPANWCGEVSVTSLATITKLIADPYGFVSPQMSHQICSLRKPQAIGLKG